MTTCWLVAYDGSGAGRRAVDFAVEGARRSGASLVLAHVLEWSPYTFLSAEELAERHKRRAEELLRARTAIVDPLLAQLAGTGVTVEAEIRYGHVAETLIDIARDKGAVQLFIGRTGQSTLVARLFGSVAGSLAQIAPVPVTIVP